MTLFLAMVAASAGVAGPSLADDACGDANAREIVVCRRRERGGESRYRLPLRDPGFDPNGGIDSVSRERHRLIDADGGAPDKTRGSCSAVGVDGATGCMVKGWREDRQQRGGR